MEKFEYIGPYIQYVRKRKGIDASDISIHTRTSYLELINIESGKIEAHPNTLKRICDYVGIDFVNLFKKQDKYKNLLVELFHALTFDINDEQEVLMKKVDKINFDESILFPEYLLVKLMYIAMNDDRSDEYRVLLDELAVFVNVLDSDYKGLYYIYKGIYYREQGELLNAMSCFRLADDTSSFAFRELLYHHLGVLYYLMDDDLTSLIYYQKAFQSYEKKWNINRLLYTKASIGFCYVSMREHAMAEKELLETLSLAKQYKNDFVICNCYDNLSYNYLLQRKYEACITYGLYAVKAGSTYVYLNFYLAYSYVKLHQYGDAALWSGKRDMMDKTSVAYQLLMYVKKLIDQQDDPVYIKHVYERLTGYDLKEIRFFMLEDLADMYHTQSNYIEENKIQRTMIELLK